VFELLFELLLAVELSLVFVFEFRFELLLVDEFALALVLVLLLLFEFVTGSFTPELPRFSFCCAIILGITIAAAIPNPVTVTRSKATIAITHGQTRRLAAGAVGANCCGAR